MAAISIDGTPMTALPSDADQINYDNTSSGLSATEVQDAIDELALEKKDEYATITYAQWQTLTPAQQAAKDYYISDYPSSQISAGNVSYNNSSSGMVANNVQNAVDELKSDLNNATTINSQTIGNFLLSKVGHVVMISLSNGVISTDSEGYVLLDGERLIIPSGYRPITTINAVESYAKKRLSIDIGGKINLPNDLSATGLIIRFETVYLAN